VPWLARAAIIHAGQYAQPAVLARRERRAAALAAA